MKWVKIQLGCGHVHIIPAENDLEKVKKGEMPLRYIEDLH